MTVTEFKNKVKEAFPELNNRFTWVGPHNDITCDRETMGVLIEFGTKKMYAVFAVDDDGWQNTENIRKHFISWSDPVNAKVVNDFLLKQPCFDYRKLEEHRLCDCLIEVLMNCGCRCGGK